MVIEPTVFEPLKFYCISSRLSKFGKPIASTAGNCPFLHLLQAQQWIDHSCTYCKHSRELTIPAPIASTAGNCPFPHLLQAQQWIDHSCTYCKHSRELPIPAPIASTAGNCPFLHLLQAQQGIAHSCTYCKHSRELTIPAPIASTAGNWPFLHLLQAQQGIDHSCTYCKHSRELSYLYPITVTPDASTYGWIDDLRFMSFSTVFRGWSSGAMVLGKLPVLGLPTSLDDSKARAYCAYSRCGSGLFGHFFSDLSSLYFLPFSGRRPDIDWNTVSKGR